MCNSLHKTVFVLLILGSLIWCQDSAVTTSPELDLDVYGGNGSILAVWSLPDSAEVEFISVMRGLDPVGILAVVNRLSAGETRFLDRGAVPGLRYFYRVEIKLVDGTIISSSIDTPPFTSCYYKDHEFSELITRSADAADFNHFDYFDLVIEELIRQDFTDLKDAEIKYLAQLLTEKETTITSWFDQFPLAVFHKYSALADLTFGTEFIQRVNESFNELGIEFRNELMLTPDEWNDYSIEFAAPIVGNLSLLNNKYLEAADLLSDCEPIRVTCASKDTTEDYLLELTVFNPDRLIDQNLSIRIRQAGISWNSDREIFIGSRDTVNIGNDPGWVEVVLDDILIQEFYLGKVNEPFFLTVNDEFFDAPPDSGYTMLLMEKQANPLFNEIGYDYESSQITVEMVAGGDTTGTYGLFINDSLRIKMQLEEFQYNVFMLDATGLAQGCWLTLGLLQDDDSWTLIEKRPLNLSGDYNLARMPDAGSWTVTDFSTYGATNQLPLKTSAEIEVPEVFALFQNYPNPFNATTTIVFDLLQPAILNLFITDATGRKISVFMEDEQTDAGNYQFSWDGRGYSSGVYFFTIQAQVDEYFPVTFSRKMIYLK